MGSAIKIAAPSAEALDGERARPEFVRNDLGPVVDAVDKPLPLAERAWNSSSLRKAVLLAVLFAVWEMAGRHFAADGRELVLPTFSSSIEAFWRAVSAGTLLEQGWNSIRMLLIGYAAGLLLAAILATLAMASRVGNDLLETATAAFSPLPAIAILPLAMIWFGLGTASLVFVLIHAVLWPVALNMHGGFKSVSNTLRMVGGNYGMTGPRLAVKILFPAAFPSILTGMKIGWAFAWRTLIAAELVFGVASGTGGLGWFIFEAKNNLEIPQVFAGLLAVIAIGLFVEAAVFRPLEAVTVKRWGMSH